MCEIDEGEGEKEEEKF